MEDASQQAECDPICRQKKGHSQEASNPESQIESGTEKKIDRNEQREP